MHEPFCIKHTTRCRNCDELLNKEDYEEHQLEFHSIKSCGDCGKKFEARFFETHQKKCSHKPYICSYCELSMPKEELHEHEYSCGSKTEKCTQCGKLIPIMEFELHLNYTCEGKTKKEEKPFGKTKFDQHFSNNNRLQKEFSKCKETMSSNFNSDNQTKFDNHLMKNKFSNNLHVENKTIDDFIFPSPVSNGEKFKYLGNKKNTQEFDKKIGKSDSINTRQIKEKEIKPNSSKNSFYLKDLENLKNKISNDVEDEGNKESDLEEKILYVNKIKNNFEKIPFRMKNKKYLKNENDHDVDEDLLKSVLESSKFDV